MNNQWKSGNNRYVTWTCGTEITVRNEVREFINTWPEDCIVKNKYGVEFYNIPIAFDIETTSFYDGSEKRACMYHWQVGLNFLPILGRTWDEFNDFLDFLIEELAIYYRRRIVIYVHNLSFEFQFLRKRFRWKKVFAMKPRKPIYAITDTGIEFRCSYYLSGFSLAKIGENLLHHDVRKMSGDLDYSLMRHCGTSLSEKELGYCINDVIVLNAYIEEKIESDGSIIKIPMTKTGYVRRGFSDACFHNKEVDKNRRNYYLLRFSRFISGLTLTPKDYQELKRVFQGGFTHSNPYITGETLEDVTSYDLTSSYPTVMIAEKFPTGTGYHIPDDELTNTEFYSNINKFACMFDCIFINLRPKFMFDYYLSSSKCKELKNPIVSNGRIVSADELITSLTEQDFDIMQKCYEWDSFRPFNFVRYKKSYLPRDFIKYLLKLYRDKTTLKGVEGKEAEYLASKEQINSAYGMSVTDIVRDSYEYKEDGWQSPKTPELEKAIEKYNNDKKRFLFYPWGVWVTAYARHNLWDAILECGADYCYSDTDSVKIRHAEEHKAFFDSYNKRITNKLRIALNFHTLPFDLCRPCTVKGVSKPLGVYDFDGHYKRFKTLGAKRYLVEYDDGRYALTVAGLGKKDALQYMEELSERLEKDMFDIFSRNLTIPKGRTGGSTITYIDDAFTCVLVDYNGVPMEVHEESCIHMESDSYSMSITQSFLNYIQYIKGDGTVETL